MNINKTTLSNGLRLITVPMADNPAVTVLVMVEAGSKYETKETNGLSHFLEHMVFKGTTKRPKAVEISRELDSIGAHYNAFTGQEYTGYYAKVATDRFGQALDIVSDMFVNPLFNSVEAEKEKGVIIEELRMYQDLPQHQVQDVLNELLHGDQPAGWKIIGTESNVRSFTSEKLLTYRSEHYVASSTIVIVAGSFDEVSIKSQVEKAFSTISTFATKAKVAVNNSQSAPQCKTLFKETDQTHIALAVRTFPILDPRAPVMSVLSTLLGGSMSSRLFAKMREELGICYYINASHSPSTDHGELTISAGVDNSRAKEAVSGIIGECSRLKNELVSEAELKKVKDYLSGTTLLGLETSDARAEFCGYQEILKHIIQNPADLIAKIQAVTASQVKTLAQEIFVDSGLNMAVVGKYKDGEIFKNLLHF